VDVFVAIAEPNRRRILELLTTGDHGAGEIAAVVPALTQPAVSRHLRVLRESGLVHVRASGQRRIYGLEPAGLQAVDAWLERYRTFWTSALDRLDRQLTVEPER
jgi:DNA-binding transcriptional ArsR family regulator